MSKIQKNASARGKNTEKSFLKLLVDNGIEATRVQRYSNYSVSDVDIKITGQPHIKIDTKSRGKFAVSTLFEQDVLERYCKKDSDRGCMPIKYKGQRGFYIVIEDKFFIEMLKCYMEKNDRQ